MPVTLCGEMAGNPLAAMALIGLGYRSLSMSAAAIGPVKAMTLALDAGKLAGALDSRSSTTATPKTAFGPARRLRRGGRRAYLKLQSAAPDGARANEQSMLPRRKDQRPRRPPRGHRRTGCRRRSTAIRWSSSAASGPSSSRSTRRSRELQRGGSRARGADRAPRRSGDGRRSPAARRKRSTSASWTLTETVRLLLLPKDAADEKSAILEIRAGTGGDEAALFAGDLFRMYQRYADLHGWKVEVLSESQGDAGGYKEIIANVDRQGRVRPAEVRVGRASRAARAGDRGERAHPHLGGDGRGAAGGRGRRHRHPAGGHPRRYARAPRAPAASTPTPPTRRCA